MTYSIRKSSVRSVDWPGPIPHAVPVQDEHPSGSPLQPAWLTPDFRERHPRARPGRKPCRAHRKARCRVCGLHGELCVCSELPRVHLPFELLLVQHNIEEHRPTNTGRLMLHMLPHSRILRYGKIDTPLDEASFREPGRRYLILFPRDGARVVTRDHLVPPDGTPVTLVVPDGNWRQASRVVRRSPALCSMPCLSLPPGPPGTWTIRNSRCPDRLCTAEALIRVVELAGFPDAARRMHAMVMLINDRMIAMRPKHASTRPPLRGSAAPCQQP